MTKKVLLIAVFLLSVAMNAQRAQRIGYIDMEYILENLPEYTEAQAKINAKAITWQNNIEKQQKEIDDLKTELANEKELLTKDLIAEREEDIEIKQLDLKKLQAAYFGTKGDLYFMRQQLVKPIQDLVFNAVQDIAKKRKYDFVLDKSSDLIMLYTNKTYDISDIVITNITRIKKTNETLAKKDKRKKDLEAKSKTTTIPNEKAEKKISDREAKRAELLKKIEDRKAAQLKKREDLKKAIEEKRQKRIKEIEDAKKVKDEKEVEPKEKENVEKEVEPKEKVVKDTIKTTTKEPTEKVEKKISDREAKKAELQKRIEDRKAAQLKKREELVKAIEEKRQKRLKEIEDAKKAKAEKEKEDQ